jgi:uncharacterized membrane protein YoaK (UPF0700 family)
MHLAYRETAILFGIGVTLHNLEESVNGPRWMREQQMPFFVPNGAIYWALTSLVSAVIWAVVLGVSLEPRNNEFQNVLTGFALAMALNAVFPHLAMSLARRSYVPGTASGVLLNLPLGIALIGDRMASAPSNLLAWRSAVEFALLLGAGSMGALYGAHTFLAWRRNRPR